MKTATALILLLAASIVQGPAASAQLSVLGSFNPDGAGDLCSVAYDPAAETVWAYPCSAAVIYGFATDGTPTDTLTRPGESANDADLDLASAELTFGETLIPAGTLLFFNGEVDSTEVYAIDTASDTILDTLVTRFGNSHVVGGAFHPERGTLFLLQDNVPNAAVSNRIAEIDPATGDTLMTFGIADHFDVFYGDHDVCEWTGNLFVVSSSQNTMAEFMADGTFIQTHALPAEVSGLSGISVDCDSDQAWAVSTSGTIFSLSGGGVFVGETVAREDTPELPRGYELSAPYPTPFNPQTTFTLAVDQAQRVQIAAYSLLGQRVALLHDGLLQPGSPHTFTFEAGRLPSGVYLIRVVGERFAASTRAVLQK